MAVTATSAGGSVVAAVDSIFTWSSFVVFTTLSGEVEGWYAELHDAILIVSDQSLFIEYHTCSPLVKVNDPAEASVKLVTLAPPVEEVSIVA